MGVMWPGAWIVSLGVGLVWSLVVTFVAVLVIRRERAARPESQAQVEERLRRQTEELVQANQALQHAAVSLEFLAGASAEVSQSLDYDLTLSRVTRLAVPELADWCTVDLLEDDGRIHRVAAAHADPIRETLLHETLQQFPIRLEEPRGVAIALRTGQTLIQPEITEEEVRTVARDERHLHILQTLRPCSHLIVPMISHGKRIGALSLLYSHDSGRRYSDADRALAEDLARRCGQAVENAQLYRAASEAQERVIKANQELERSNEILQLEMAERLLSQEQLLEANLQLEQALEDIGRANEVIRRQERLRALGELASGIAHDFNNALGMIVGFSDLLIEDPQALDEPDAARAQIRQIQNAAIGAGAVVSRLREFYRPHNEREPMVPVQLNDIIAQAISLTQPRWRDQAQAAGRTIAVSTELQLIPTVDGVATSLLEALANLILNAVDAMPNGGALTIRTGRTADQVMVEVCDTGVGMPPSVRDRIFEPFFTTKGDDGTGLGLALVRGIIERHGGEIQVTSAENQGTTFTICLPIGVSTAGSDAPASEPPRQRGLRVLLAEDEPSLRRIFSSYLQIDRHEVVAAANGQEALEMLRTGAFDLVITDRAMPELNGDQLAAEVQRVAPGTPVIMLTGLGELMQDAEIMPAGVNVVVAKPVTLASFREAITEVTTDSLTPQQS